MYDGGERYFGPDRELSYHQFSKLAGRDRGNFQEKVERQRHEGTQLSPKLEWDAFVAAYLSHEEIPLHSYPRRIMTLMRSLRISEVRAREAIAGFDPTKYEDPHHAAEALHSLFIFHASQIGDVYYVYVLEALGADQKETATLDEKCDLYCAAASLQTLVDIWDEAASVMKSLNVNENGQLGFEFLGIEEIVTVVDAAEKAFEFYGEVELILKKELSSTSDEKLRSLLQKDWEIAATNMASVASYGFDWIRAQAEFSDIICIRSEAADIRVRAKNLVACGSLPLKRSVGLFQRHPDHVLLGRNLIYMGIQQRNKEVVEVVAKQLAHVLNYEPSDILQKQMAGRKPLEKEPHLEIDDEVRSWFANEETAI